MMDQTYQEIQTRAHILGALFYYGPKANETAEIIKRLRSGMMVELVPELNIDQWQQSLDNSNIETLPQAWQSMFIGPYEFSAPPWGSVYLDKENVIFGDSLLTLRAFMMEHGLGFNNIHNEAEDHIGLMFLLLAMLCETDQSAVAIFLEEHLLPWAPVYCQCLHQANAHPFINLLSQYASECLTQWQNRLKLTPQALKIYWPISTAEL